MSTDLDRTDLEDAREEFRARLRMALRHEAQRSAIRLGSSLLRAALDEPPAAHRLRPGPIGTGAIAAAALLLFAVLILPPRTGGPATGQATGTLPSLATASPAVSGAPPPITLADCQIYPEDASLAFSGWATTNVLRVSGGTAAPGQPVYALVTRGLAEWMGWRSPDPGPIYPPPVGRMGCILDPSTGVVSQVGVPLDWEPPAMIDGCPASAEDEYAGYREIGGPRAWALLPTGPSGWASGQRALILYRLSPPLTATETLTAWAIPLDGGGRVDGRVGTVPAALASEGAAASPGQDEFSYYVVEQRLPGSGCWVLNVAVNGHLAGSAITSVASSP